MSLTAWAFDLSEQKLRNALPRRWAHVQGVARQARSLAPIAGSDAGFLEAAAILHDIGYAPDLVDTGFHPIDGATYLAKIGAPERIVHLVAHHSFAVYEAQLRGLEDDIACFEDERGPIRDALWYCDITTSPDGETVAAEDRIAEIQQRYGPDHLVTRFITGAAPELLAAVKRTERRMAAAQAARRIELIKMSSRKPSFDLGELVGCSTPEAVRRCEDDGFVVEVIDLDRPQPVLLTYSPDRIRLVARADRVTEARQG